MSLSFQQNWFHLIRSSFAQDIAVLVFAENMFLSAFTGSTASQGGSTARAFPSPVVSEVLPGYYRPRACQTRGTPSCNISFHAGCTGWKLSVVPARWESIGIEPLAQLQRLYRWGTGTTGRAGKLPNGQIRGELFKWGLLPPWFLTLPTLSPPLLSFEELAIPPHPSHESCIFLRENREEI